VIEDQQGVLKVNRRAITTGEVREGMVAVVKGLKAGDRVVAVGQNRLRNEMPVEIAPEP
jgi:multidrug efflux pump subunit AcrA (membrane-fusion protein)